MLKILYNELVKQVTAAQTIDSGKLNEYDAKSKDIEDKVPNLDKYITFKNWINILVKYTKQN